MKKLVILVAVLTLVSCSSTSTSEETVATDSLETTVAVDSVATDSVSVSVSDSVVVE